MGCLHPFKGSNLISLFYRLITHICICVVHGGRPYKAIGMYGLTRLGGGAVFGSWFTYISRVDCFGKPSLREV